MSWLLVGSANHRYNFAVNEFMSENRNIIASFKVIMSKLCYPLRRLKERKFTNYALVKTNGTRSSSTYSMLSRYVLIRKYLPKLGIPDIDDLLLDRKEDQDVDRILGVMKKLSSITLKLQHGDVCLSQIRFFLTYRRIYAKFGVKT